MDKLFSELTERWVIDWLSISTLEDSDPETSAVGTTSGEDSSEFDSPEAKQDTDRKILLSYIETYRKRLCSYKPTISAVIDELDFQPVNFLQIGLERSAAVCRISRYFSSEAFKELIQYLKSKIEEQHTRFQEIESNPFCDPSRELKIKFSIPDAVFYEIFKKITTKLTFQESLDILEANAEKLLQANPIAIGTGFLVGGSHLLTNHHVIPDEEKAEQYVAQFGYVNVNANQESISTVDYDFDPRILFISDPKLDYTLVQLKPGWSRRPAGYMFGWLDLIESEDCINPRLDDLDQVKKLIKALKKYGHSDKELIYYGLTEEQSIPGDRVVIIQHPRGRKKELVLQNNEVLKLSFNNLDCQADTDYGSSGSPVFNTSWELVAQIKRVVPRFNQKTDGTRSTEQESSVEQGDSKSQFPWIKVQASRGTRICRIVEDLKKKSNSNLKLKSFIEDFVVTSEQLNYPPLPSALEFDGERSYVDLGNHESLDVTDAITVEVWVRRKPDSGDGIIFSRDESYSLYWLQGKIWVQMKNNNESISCIEGAALNDGLWHHIAFTWDKKLKTAPNQNIQVFFDGVIQLDIQGNKEFTESLRKSRMSLNIGCNQEKTSYFSGYIAEVRLWKVARTEAQIKANMYRRLSSDDKTDLIGYWRFEEGESEKVYNRAKSYADNFPEIDLAPFIALAQPSFGMQLNGSSNYIDGGDYESLKIDEAITLEAWVKSNNNLGMIVNQGGSWEENGYSLFWYENKIRVELQNSNEKTVVDMILLLDNNWHHIAFTWDKSLQKIEIYVDGKSQETKTSKEKQKPGVVGHFEGPIGKSRWNLNIGRAQGHRYDYFNGSIAEVRLWNIARTEEQIKENMSRQLQVPDSEPGLVGYWRLDEEEGDRAANLASENAHAVVHGGQWLKNRSNPNIDPFALTALTQPQFGLHINSSKSDYIDCGIYKSFALEDAITLEAWFKYKTIPGFLLNGIIVNRGGAWVENGYSLFWYGGKIRVELQNKSQDNKTIVDTINSVPNHDLWHHVAFTWDKESKTIQIYVDGVKQETTFADSSKPFEGPIGEPRLRLNIGRAQDYGFYFNGSIAEVRLWKIAQTEEQIKENMSRQLQGSEPGLVGYWRLDEEEGDSAENLVSKNAHAVVHGGQWLKPYNLLAANQGTYGIAYRTKWLKASQYPALPLPFGLKFDENKSYINCGNGEGLDTPATITVEAWVKHKFGNCVIVSRSGIVKLDGSLEKGYSLAWYDGKIRVALSDGTSEKTIVYSKENALADRIWHHIAFTWDKESEEIAIYIDGRRQDSVVEGKSNAILFQGQSKSIGLFAGLINNPAANLIIGLKEAKETYYSVAIAEVRLWNVCRAQDQIKADMSRRLKGNEEGLVGYWRLDDGGEGNNQVRNLVSDKNHGTIYGATWWNPVREITDTGNKGDSTDNPPETPPSNQTS